MDLLTGGNGIAHPRDRNVSAGAKVMEEMRAGRGDRNGPPLYLNAGQIDRELVLALMDAPRGNYPAGDVRSCRQNNISVYGDIIGQAYGKRGSYHIDRRNCLQAAHDQDSSSRDG